MKGSIRISTLAAGIMLATNAIAADESTDPTRQYLAPMMHYLILDDDRDISSKGLGGGLIYGRQLSDHLWWETEGAGYGLDTGVDDVTDFFQYSLSTGVAYAFGDREGFTPFVLAQIGGIYNDVVPDDDDGLNLHANVGVGAVTGPIFDNGLKLRFEGRYMYDDFDGVSGTTSDGEGGFNDWRLSLGLEIPLGVTRTVEVEKIVYQTREVEKVVEKVVAEADSDNDGIADSRDMCPNTLAGGKVDGQGCLLKNQTISFNNIGFELNSAKITASSRPTLDKLADSLNAQTDFNVEIAGHTDSSGSAEYNESLSDKRANSVRKYLIEKGVAAERLTSRGYGEVDPVASNETAAGRAMNRRVEFRVSE
ncbi:OmpA family protein [Alcanivorax sediminis]|uniref:OmpA family protein n=1 Tax=Alcanivorax sediminis TaxID=2663008 RepID=A0A6N7LWG6_9GAMM|nr:OmpA family protein [Alcanivorax sediminis]MQX53736.1 OmpA family protein [Alcanivorax sediminis]